jgi:tetratricopeptide (TPR) repeat protein
MMKMVGDINGVYLSRLDRDPVEQVRCVTCHHGITHPETIDEVVLEAAREDGVDAALVKYRELRAEYYGTAAYNFSAMPLNEAAQVLAQERNDLPGAIAVMKVNLEYNPDDAAAHLLMGRLYQASGDKAAAIASVEKSLALDPENRWAKEMLEKLKASE